MRTGKIEINGKEYITVFSSAVIMDIEGKGNTVEAFLSKIQNEMPVSEILWLTQRMIVAGDKYAKLTGLDSPGSISLEDMAALLAPEDYGKLLDCISETLTGSNKREVEAEPPKNAKATRPIKAE